MIRDKNCCDSEILDRAAVRGFGSVFFSVICYSVPLILRDVMNSRAVWHVFACLLTPHDHATDPSSHPPPSRLPTHAPTFPSCQTACALQYWTVEGGLDIGLSQRALVALSIETWWGLNINSVVPHLVLPPTCYCALVHYCQ